VLRLGSTFLLLFVLAATPSLAGVVLIANADNAEGVLDHDEIKRIYLGKKTRWSDDTPIIPVILKNGDTHEEFLDEYLNRTAHRFVSYWRQMVFTGKGIPPKSFTDEAELIAFVANTPGSVGYVSESSLVPEVQALTIR